MFCFLQMFVREIELDLEDGEEKVVKLDQKFERGDDPTPLLTPEI